MTSGKQKSYKVVVIDDEPDKAERCLNALRALAFGGMDISAPGLGEIGQMLDSLYDRRSAVDRGEDIHSVGSEFDRIDVLIVDFDLRDLSAHRGFATGEEIAYSARLYSAVKIIVVVNHPNVGLDNFDLTLQRDREFKADYYMGSDQVASPKLWSHVPTEPQFCPWHWVPLLEDVESFQSCFEEIRNRLDVGVLEFFSLTGPDNTPSAEMLSWVGAKEGKDITFRNLMAEPTAAYVRRRDLPSLLKDDVRNARVLTAYLRKWIRRWVVTPQTLLADLPHLATVLPWGLRDYSNADLWGQLAVQGRSMNSIRRLGDLVRAEVASCMHPKAQWAGRPIFNIRQAGSALEKVPDALAAFKASNLPPVVFAEDLSEFIPAVQAIEYPVTIDGEQRIRAVCNPAAVAHEKLRRVVEEIVYAPQSLLL